MKINRDEKGELKRQFIDFATKEEIEMKILAWKIEGLICKNKRRDLKRSWRDTLLKIMKTYIIKDHEEMHYKRSWRDTL